MEKISKIKIFLIGCVMGLADLVPGVSGGTIAFVAGIYDELITSIKCVTNNSLALVVRGKFKEAVKTIPFGFLLPLFSGIFLFIFSMAGVLSWLLEKHSSFVWSFFFGLVVASTLIILRRLKSLTVNVMIAFAAGIVISYVISGLVPVETPLTSLSVFLSGAIAITAMVLPGISGSFILVVLGKYEQILNAVAQRDIFVIVIFVLGAFVGLALFSRLISWFLKTKHDTAIAILSGFMLGSLRTIWPWKSESVSGVVANAIPDGFDMPVIFIILLAILGFVLVWVLNRFSIIDKD